MADLTFRPDVEITQSLRGDASAVITEVLFPPVTPVPATATVTGQALALVDGAVSARGAAFGAVAGQLLALEQGAVTANDGSATPPTVIIPFAGPAQRPKRARIGLADLPQLFPEPEVPELVVVAAVATVQGLALALHQGDARATGAAIAGAAGVALRAATGATQARGIHNPTDEELLAWLAAA